MTADLKFKIPVVYSESYYVDIGKHVFPTSKYRILKKRLDSDKSLEGRFEIIEPEKAKEGQVLAVHTEEYVNKLKTCSLSEAEAFTLEVPL